MFWNGIVKTWDQRASRGQIRSDRKQCVGCGEIPFAFVICELRPKGFLALVGDYIHEFEAITIRFRCPLCGHRFTMQPPWGLPRKRYVKGVILSVCWRYLRKMDATYRSLLGGAGYKADERQPSHSRAWHWLKDLGEMVSALDLAKRLILAKDPGTESVGQAIHIAVTKYKGPSRRSLLQAAHGLLQLRREWFRLFRVAFPPKIGTTGP